MLIACTYGETFIILVVQYLHTFTTFSNLSIFFVLKNLKQFPSYLDFILLIFTYFATLKYQLLSGRERHN